MASKVKQIGLFVLDAFCAFLDPSQYGLVVVDKQMLTEVDEDYACRQYFKRRKGLRFLRRDCIGLLMSVFGIYLWSLIMRILPFSPEFCKHFAVALVFVLLSTVMCLRQAACNTSNGSYYPLLMSMLLVIPLIIVQSLLVIYLDAEMTALKLFFVGIGYLFFVVNGIIIHVYYTLWKTMDSINGDNEVVASFIRKLKPIDSWYYYEKSLHKVPRVHYYLTRQNIANHLMSKVKCFRDLKSFLKLDAKLDSELPGVYGVVDEKLKNVFFDLKVADYSAMIIKEYSTFALLMQSDCLTEFFCNSVFEDSVVNVIVNIYRLSQFYGSASQPQFCANGLKTSKAKTESVNPVVETPKESLLSLLYVFAEMIDNSQGLPEDARMLIQVLDRMHETIHRNKSDQVIKADKEEDGDRSNESFESKEEQEDIEPSPRRDVVQEMQGFLAQRKLISEHLGSRFKDDINADPPPDTKSAIDLDLIKPAAVGIESKMEPSDDVIIPPPRSIAAMCIAKMNLGPDTFYHDSDQEDQDDDSAHE